MSHRDTKGRFVKGHPGGPGRPPAASVHRHRRAMIDAVGPDVIAGIMRKLCTLALQGDVGAARCVLDRFFGRPMDTETAERIERIEQLLEEGDGEHGLN